MNQAALLLTIFLPLFGSLLSFFTSALWGERLTSWFLTSCIGTSLILFLFGLYGSIFPEVTPLCHWIGETNFNISWTLLMDFFNTNLIGILLCISFVLHLYAMISLKKSLGTGRLLLLLSLVTFFMLVTLTSSDLVILFIGWQGMTVCAYLLIAHGYERSQAGRAAFRAFVTNYIGDIGFLLGISLLYKFFQTTDFRDLFQHIKHHHEVSLMMFGFSIPVLTLATFFFFISAMGKSAQFIFYRWLPDGTQAPTCALALLQTVTMIAAGVFLMIRLSPLLAFSPLTQHIMIFLGSFTTIGGAFLACFQNDSKRIMAYGTISQVGGMFTLIGLGDIHGAFYYLIIFAFCMSALLLSIESVVQAMSDEQNIQRMGGIFSFTPLTWTGMLLGSVMLVFISLFFIHTFFRASSPYAQFAFTLGSLSISFTGFYLCRLLCRVFSGSPRAHEAVMSHIKESCPFILSLIFFLIFSLITLFFFQISQHKVDFLWIDLYPFLSLIVGGGLSLFFYLYRDQELWLSAPFNRLYGFLNDTEETPFKHLSGHLMCKVANFFSHRIEQRGMERGIDLSVISLAKAMSLLAMRLQKGSFSHDSLAMALGIAISFLCALIFMYGVSSS